ncbi:hypothetical protein V6615_10510 [Oscillospiraceae bacterium PP1C4]
MNAQEHFFEFMETYTEFFESMVSVEKEKLEALLSFQLKKIEQAISAGQANAMKLENYEKKRMELQVQAGFAEATFQEIIDSIDGELKKVLENLLRRMNNAVQEIKFYNGKSMGLAKINLQSINDAVPSSARSEAQGYTSLKTQADAYKNTVSFETKI